MSCQVCGGNARSRWFNEVSANTPKARVFASCTSACSTTTFTFSQKSKHGSKKIGRVFKQRYHQHQLTSAREVRNAVLYVIKNATKHRVVPAQAYDIYSSAPYFDGYLHLNKEKDRHARPREPPDNLVQEAKTSLLTRQWRHFGLIARWEKPIAP